MNNDIDNEKEQGAEQPAFLPIVQGYALVAEQLNAYTNDQTARVTKRYKDLGDYLFVKYLDGNIKKEKDGGFERTPEGMPVQPTFGGYNQRYFDSIVKETGEHFKVD